LGEDVFVNLSLRDESGQVFDGDALPMVPPEINAFDHRLLRIESGEELPLLVLEGEIFSLVPEPGTALLVGAGAVVMLLRRGKRRFPINGRCTGGKA
jgi:hypothetical protein